MELAGLREQGTAEPSDDEVGAEAGRVVDECLRVEAVEGLLEPRRELVFTEDALWEIADHALERETGAAIEASCSAPLVNQIGKDTLPELLARVHEIVGTLLPARNFYVALHDAEATLLVTCQDENAIAVVDVAGYYVPERRGLTSLHERLGVGPALVLAFPVGGGRAQRLRAHRVPQDREARGGHGEVILPFIGAVPDEVVARMFHAASLLREHRVTTLAYERAVEYANRAMSASDTTCACSMRRRRLGADGETAELRSAWTGRRPVPTQDWKGFEYGGYQS